MFGRSAAGSIVAAAVLASVAACSAAPATPTWTKAPPSSVVSPPPPSSPARSPQVTLSPAATPASPTRSPEVVPPTPRPSTEPGQQTGLSEAEFGTLTGGDASYTAVDPPPPISRGTAEAIVRAAYPGDRPLVASEMVAFGERPRIAWLVVLGAAPGQTCSFHPGLLERALEGGMVDAETGDLFWTMTCG